MGDVVASGGYYVAATADAVSALVNLGYGRSEAFGAVAQVAQRLGPDAGVEEAQKIHDGPADGGLARPGLSDQAQDLSIEEVEIDPVDRADLPDPAAEHASGDRKGDAQTADREQGFAVRRHGVSPGKWQRTSWPGVISRSSGSSMRQRSVASAQRPA